VVALHLTPMLMDRGNDCLGIFRMLNGPMVARSLLDNASVEYRRQGRKGTPPIWRRHNKLNTRRFELEESDRLRAIARDRESPDAFRFPILLGGASPPMSHRLHAEENESVKPIFF
jgi:hypothetical protein